MPSIILDVWKTTGIVWRSIQNNETNKQFPYYNRLFVAVQNKTLVDKNLSKQVDLWKTCYVEKSKPSPTFLTVLDEMWED